MAAGRQQLRRIFACIAPRRLLLVRGPAGRRSVGLTFDDGPHPVHTPRLLDALARQRLRATFFVVGRLAERYPAIVQRIASEGHDVGQHSYEHSDPSNTTAKVLIEEIERTSKLLEEQLGVRTKLFRPPMGALTVAKAFAAWTARQTIVLWSVNPRDYAATTPSAVWTALCGRPFVAGDIVLLHDSRPHAVDVVPKLAEWLRRRRLTSEGVSAWVNGHPAVSRAEQDVNG